MGGTWSAFAKENGGHSLLDNPPVGRSIWEFIEGLSTRNIYALAMKQVRNKGRSICFPFRNDSPEMLRYMNMHIESGAAGSLWFRTTIQREIRKDTLAEKNVPKPENHPNYLVHMCAWCNLVEVAGEWFSLASAIWALGLLDGPEVPPITHGICPKCVGQINERHENHQTPKESLTTPGRLILKTAG
jgi:hypothetical protein